MEMSPATLWRSRQELYDDEQATFSLGSSRGINNQYQVYAIIDETSEEFDNNNNPICWNYALEAIIKMLLL
jgi:hypothetical protein